MTGVCHLTSEITPLKFIFCSKKGTPKNGTSHTSICGSYSPSSPPPPGKSLQFCWTASTISITFVLNHFLSILILFLLFKSDSYFDFCWLHVRYDSENIKPTILSPKRVRCSVLWNTRGRSAILFAVTPFYVVTRPRTG